MALEAKEKKSFGAKWKALYERIKILYEKLDGVSPLKAWLIMLGVAAACLLFVLLPFLFRGTYTVWTELAGDAATQFLTFLTHMKEVGWLKAIGSYDFYMGLGADYLTSLSFYSLFDPYNVFFFILPFGELMNYTITMALKQLTCAITMFAYLRYKKVRNSRAILLSVAYMVTGFVAFTFVRHYNLAVGPIYFPLAILGVEKLFNKERPYLFILSTFLCLCSNFYVFFSLSVFVVAYTIAYYFHENALRGKRSSVGDFFKRLTPIGLYYLLGVALAGVLLLPNIYGYLHAARSASKGLDFFAFDTFVANMATLVLPTPGRNYSSLCLNVANGALALYALFKPNKNTRLYGIFVIVLTVGFLLPVFGFAMNIFNYSNNRWSYGLSFFVYAMIGVQSNDGAEGAYDERTTKKINIWFVVYAAIILACGLPAIMTLLGWQEWWLIVLAIGLACGVGYGAFVLVKRIWKGGVPVFFKKIYQPTVLFTLGFVLATVSSFGYYMVYSGQHEGKARYGALFSAEEQYVSELVAHSYPFGSNLGAGNPSSPSGDYGYFRTDSFVSEEWYGNFSNRSLNNGYYGTNMYNSVSDGGVYEFFKENGVYNPAQNLGISGLDERFALQSLLSVRYLYDPFGGAYGFTNVEGQEHLYENENYMPMGFVADRVYSREYYLSQDVLERQYLLLNGAVIEGVDPTADGTYTPSLTSYVAVGADGLQASGVQTIRKDQPVKFTLRPSEYEGREVYLVIRGVKEVGRSTYINVTCNGRQKQYYYSKKGNLMYSEQRDIYLNFGVVEGASETDTLEFTVSLQSGSPVRFDEIRIQSSPTSAHESALAARSNAAHLEGVLIGRNSLKGSLQSDKEGYMLLTIPYSEGWTAYIDGKQTQIYKADTAFMAIKVSASDTPQTVEFRYETPLFKEGKWISFGGLGILGAVIVADTTVRAVRRRKRKKETV